MKHLLYLHGRAARQAGADLVIPFMHWGWERERQPTERQRQLARLMIDNGADVVVGYALLLAQHLGLAPQFGTATQAYWQRLQARPGYQRAMAAQTRAAEEQGVPTTPAPDTQP